MNMIRFHGVILLAILFCSHCSAQEPIRLPKPDTTGGKPLMQTLKERKTSRSFAKEKLSPQILSNLLWAAFGINRPDGHRTAPSAMNWQEMDIYVVMEDGVFLYAAASHSLKSVLNEDKRELTGTQDFVKDAPLNLVYVANFAKAQRGSQEDKNLYTGADCGFIAENVYLCCSSENLACVVRGSVDRSGLAKALKLLPDQKIILAQTVGYPAR